MIIGNGMIAKKFESYRNIDHVCIFASGVSNSRETNAVEFKREFNLLKKVIKGNKNKVFVYFSTCSIEDKSLVLTPYIKHKKKIEKYIALSGIQYYIFRISQIVGYANNETLFNFFKKMIQEEKKIILLNKSTRNLIDIDDVYKIVDFMVAKKIDLNSIINVASPFTVTPFQIVSFLEKSLNKKAIYEFSDNGGSYTIDISKTTKYFKPMGVSFQDNYTMQIIHKYRKFL